MTPQDAPAATPPITVSAVIQLGPLHRPGRPGLTWSGDLDVFTDQLARYLAGNLERFADIRGGDVFLTVTAGRGTETANRVYRSGHYVSEEKP